ncbi:uncharacterized protein LOC111624892 [Centruroides sculpturatus]|uniref:uncharacterized protein LOC111624883 n=1 Tax=Centruroides sculpturatus TaxID=218467 RepID=UPI000C6E1D01|nr:uncharacterized protein LOC111624883 [Centruroides sculpturatus]XP_023223640.1 uncharacterized protein LOC111624892 [Centruroides sculpturatus]
MMCLNRAIRCTRKQLYSKLTKVVEIENSLFQSGPGILSGENAKIVNIQDRLRINLKRHYQKKFQWILQFQVPKKCKHPSFPFIVWDNIDLPSFVVEVLKFGPAFALPPKKADARSLIPDLEILLRGLSDRQKEYYRWMATLKIKNSKETSEITDLRDKLRRTVRWMKLNNITLVRADKNKSMVLMKRDTYERGLQEYLTLTHCDKADEGFIDKLHSRVKRFAGSGLAKRLALGNLVVDSPDVPKLFAFAKTHKPGQQLRPVVDKARAPTQKLEKAVHTILAPQLEGYQYSIASPVELLTQLKEITSYQYVTVLDFRSLYPSIELPPAFCALRDILFSIVGDNALHNQVLEMAHLICYNSVFQFNGEVYTQGRGVPMGSPVSGDLCEMVVRQLEKKILPQFLPNIELYRRYIDDIIIIWKNVPDITALVDAFNNNPYGLMLELEQSDTTEVHFLDINIRLEKEGISTAVYRKPGSMSSYIPIGSCDPVPYKMAAYKALIRRAFTHSSNVQARDKELTYIMRVAAEHGYRTAIRKMIKSYSRMYADKERLVDWRVDRKEVPEDMERIPVTFNPYVRSIYDKIAKKRQISIAYRRCPTIFNILRNGKDPPNPSRRPGVYSVPLRDNRFDRDLIYIGSTKRSIGVRIQEHKADIRHGRTSTALATYATDPGIVADFNRTNLLLGAPPNEHLKWLEAMHIFKSSIETTCINFKEEMILSMAWQELIHNTL